MGRESVPSGVQLPRDPPVGEQVLLNLGKKEKRKVNELFTVQGSKAMLPLELEQYLA